MSQFSAQLVGKHVLVTGGAKGIGRGIVEAFLAEGANVSYCSRSTMGDEFNSFKGAVHGARAFGTKVDISDFPALQDWIKAANENIGKIDVVVANAASPHKSSSIADWEKSFRADVLGLITLIETAAPFLAQSDGLKSIVVISSLAGFEARYPELTGPYSTVKRTQAMLAKSYARTLGPRGIRVNCIVPGAIETPALTRSDGTQEPSSFQQMKKNKPEFFEALVAQIPLGRTGLVEEVANTVIFLGSRLSSYTSGATLAIDGAMATSF